MSHETHDVPDWTEMNVEDEYREPDPASGVIVDAERGSLPYALIHGESLVAAAAWAAGEAGIELVDQSLEWEFVLDREEPFVLHDALCPMTPPEFLAECVRLATADDQIVVGVRPVTDTVKVVAGQTLGDTIDRDQLVAVCSPIVLPHRVLADLVATSDLPTLDFAALIALLRESDDVCLIEAPPSARRVVSAADIEVLSALTAPDESIVDPTF